MTQRTERVDELLRQEIGEILTKDVADPRIGFVTITDVETTPDLRHARVWVSIIGPQAERDSTLAALGRAMGFVRRELGTRLRIKRIPELHVRLDETAERGTRVLRLLQEIEEGHVPADVPPPGESLPTPIARLPHAGDVPDEVPPWQSEVGSKPRRAGRAGRGRDDGRSAGGRRSPHKGGPQRRTR
jgi:ribosome-binding factor A